MKIAVKLAAATALLTSLGAVHAQKQSAPQEPFYCGLEVGRAPLDNSTGETANLFVSALGGSASATQSSSVNDYRIFLGYKMNENFTFELGYAQSSNYDSDVAGTTSGSVAYTASARSKFKVLDVSVLLRPDVATGMNGLFLRLGGHTGELSTDVLVVSAGQSVPSSTKGGVGTLVGFGYDYNLAQNADVRFAATRWNRIGGASDVGATIYSVGALRRF